MNHLAIGFWDNSLIVTPFQAACILTLQVPKSNENGKLRRRPD
jgi:hypothetical protein